MLGSSSITLIISIELLMTFEMVLCIYKNASIYWTVSSWTMSSVRP